jgi:sporulation protein YlmC with PRC-barrel domain
MNPTLTTLYCAVLTLPLAAQAGGETGQGTKPLPRDASAMKGDKPMYVGLEQVLGTKAQATGSGGETRGEDAPELEVKDLVVKMPSGEIVWAVLSHDGRTVATPPSLIKCAQPADDVDKDAKLELQVDPARLGSLPAFDLDAAKEANFDQSIMALEASWTTIGIPVPREASASTVKEPALGAPVVIVTGTEFYSLPGRYCLASKLDGINVFTRAEEFGEIEELVLNTEEHKIAYAIVKHGGVLGVGEEKYIVPFRALHPGSPKDDTDKKVLVLDMPKDAVAIEAARYEQPEKGILSSVRAEQADKVFDAAIRAKKAQAEKSGVPDKGTGRQGG